MGFSKEKITIVQNSIDTLSFRKSIERVSDMERRSCLDLISSQDDSSLGLFCGSFYGHKNFEFIFKVVDQIKEAVPDFKFIFIGSGPDLEKIENFCRNRADYAFNLGFLENDEKAPWFSASSFMLNPGLVGLSIIDSFAAGIPIITTDAPIHSPEISYLEHGYNGLMFPNDPNVFAQNTIKLIKDPEYLTKLKRNSMISGETYTIETMVKNFSEGIENWSSLK